MYAGQSTAAWEESHFHRTIRISSKLSHFTIIKSNHQPNTAKSTTKPCHRTTERTEERGRDLKGHKSSTPEAQHPHISEVPPGMAISPVHTVPQCLSIHPSTNEFFPISHLSLPGTTAGHFFVSHHLLQNRPTAPMLQPCFKQSQRAISAFRLLQLNSVPSAISHVIL